MEDISSLNIRNDEVSIGEWIVTMILLGIPIVNLIMLIIWATSSSEKPSKRNYAKATLIMMAAMLVFIILIFIVVGSTLLHLLR